MDKKAHGGHIASLVLGNIAAVSPELINAGVFSVIVPPYYRITIGKNDYYVRGKGDLVQWKAEYFYKEILRIDIAGINYLNRTITKTEHLAGDTYTDFACVVDEIGNIILNISNELSISPYIIEALSNVSLYLTADTMNTEVIKDELGANRVSYDSVSDSLLVNIGRDDLIIPLMKVSERLYRDLRPKLARVKKSVWVPLVTTLRTDLYKEVPMTLFQVYELFQRIDELMHMDVEVLKGIGSMEARDIGAVCMDPKTRHEIRIENVGDLTRIHDLLGRESGFKKQLVAAPLSATNNMFR